MVKPIDSILKNQVEQVYVAGTKKAASEYSTLCDDIRSKTLFELAKRLQKENACIIDLIDGMNAIIFMIKIQSLPALEGSFNL